MFNEKEEQEETEVISPPYPGLSVFQLSSALRLFNRESILKDELKGNINLEFYLENRNIFLAFEKIFDKQWASMQMKLENMRDGIFTDESKTASRKTEKANPKDAGTANVKLTNDHPPDNDKQAQLVQRLHLDMSLPDSDTDSSICVSLSSSPLKESPKKRRVNLVSDTNGYKSEQDRERMAISLEDTCSYKDLELESLFLLTSVLPEAAAARCKQVMDRDHYSWKVSLYAIVKVLLNWGATFKSLELEEVCGSSYLEIFPPQLQSPCSTDLTSNELFPSPSNVRLVLSSISQRLPGESQMPFSHRVLLIRILVFAALDSRQRRNMTYFCRAVICVLESFQNWDENTAEVIISNMGLRHMRPQNSVYVSCCMFNMLSERSNLVGLLACYNVLHDVFNLPAESSLTILVLQLAPSTHLFDRFSLNEIFTITQLVHSLLVRHGLLDRNPPCPRATIEGLHQWTIEVRNALKKPDYMFNLEAGYLRERLSRLTSECANTVRKLYSDKTNKTYNNFKSQISIEDSPQK